MSYSDKINGDCGIKIEHCPPPIQCTPAVVTHKTTCAPDDCATCKPIYSYQEPSCEPSCEVAPMAYTQQDSCFAPAFKYGISDPNNGISSSYIVGLGLESRVRYDGMLVDTQYNLIPWWMNDYAAFDSSLPFTPKSWENEGLFFEAPERNRLIVKDCEGVIIKEFTAPVLGGGSGGAFNIRITDNQPLTDATIPVAAGQTLNIVAGENIDLVPTNGGFRISAPGINQTSIIQPAPNSGIVITGGSNGVPYNIGIDCGTLRSNCGLVRSVNGNLPDSNGNVSVAASGGQGITAVSTGDQIIIATYPSTGVVSLEINCANLRAKCNFVTSTNVGTAGQFLRNNGNQTATWVDLPGGTTPTPTAVAAPTNARAGQSVANGGQSSGLTNYTCGDPLLSWSPSATAGVTYEVRDNGIVLSTGITGTTYQTI